MPPSAAYTHEPQPEPTLVDLGAATELRDEPSLVVLGSPSHLAPERFATGACAAKGAVSSAGVMRSQTVAGQRSLSEDNIDALTRRHTSGQVVPPSWLLARDPAERPTADESARLVRTLVS